MEMLEHSFDLYDKNINEIGTVLLILKYDG